MQYILIIMSVISSKMKCHVIVEITALKINFAHTYVSIYIIFLISYQISHFLLKPRRYFQECQWVTMTGKPVTQLNTL